MDHKCLIVLKKKQLFQTSNLKTSWQYFLPVKCVKSVCTTSHQCLQSVNSVNNVVFKLCILNEDNELWLTAFTNEISKLLKPSSLTLHDTIEDVEDAIMNLQDITIKYNIQKILSMTLCWPKTMKKQTTSQAPQCLVYSVHDKPYKLKTIPATSMPPQK